MVSEHIATETSDSGVRYWSLYHQQWRTAYRSDDVIITDFLSMDHRGCSLIEALPTTDDVEWYRAAVASGELTR